MCRQWQRSCLTKIVLRVPQAGRSRQIGDSGRRLGRRTDHVDNLLGYLNRPRKQISDPLCRDSPDVPRMNGEPSSGHHHALIIGSVPMAESVLSSESLNSNLPPTAPQRTSNLRSEVFSVIDIRCILPPKTMIATAKSMDRRVRKLNAIRKLPHRLRRLKRKHRQKDAIHFAVTRQTSLSETRLSETPRAIYHAKTIPLLIRNRSY